MYHHDLRIAIFSCNQLLESEVRAIRPLECISHDIRVLDTFNPAALTWAEIAILDVPASMSFREMRAHVKSGTKLIACMLPEDEEKLVEDDFVCLDDLWLQPLRVPRIRLRMSNILHEIKRNDDAKQHLLWLDTLIDSMPDLVWFKDLSGVHHKVNAKFCEFVNKTRDKIIGATHSRIWDTSENDEYSCQESERAAIKAGGTILTDEIVKIGEEKHLFKTYKTPLKGLNGEILGTVGFGHDLTNLLNLDMELNLFIESMPFPLAICHEDDQIRQVNTRFLEFFRENREKITGTRFSQWQEKTFHVETSPVSGERYLRFAHDDGRMHYVSMTKKNILNIFEKKVGILNIFRDITAEKELEIRIWRDANTDSLTGLANRHAFDSFVKKLPKDAVIHLFYIDLDEFKTVNDHWGHEAGDEALKVVAKAIRNVFAQDFPVRLGGDEFLVCIQRDVPLSELERLAGNLLRRIHQKFGGSEYLAGMSASIGIRGYGRLSDSVALLIRQADVAMYSAKAMGKGRYCLWDEKMGDIIEDFLS